MLEPAALHCLFIASLCAWMLPCCCDLRMSCVQSLLLYGQGSPSPYEPVRVKRTGYRSFSMALACRRFPSLWCQYYFRCIPCGVYVWQLCCAHPFKRSGVAFANGYKSGPFWIIQVIIQDSSWRHTNPMRNMSKKATLVMCGQETT